MEKRILKRQFSYKGKILEDVNPKFTPIEVIKHYAGIMPELTNFKLGKQEIDEATGLITIHIESETGTNG